MKIFSQKVNILAIGLLVQSKVTDNNDLAVKGQGEM
jgi:hypothetical protein